MRLERETLALIEKIIFKSFNFSCALFIKLAPIFGLGNPILPTVTLSNFSQYIPNFIYKYNSRRYFI